MPPQNKCASQHAARAAKIIGPGQLVGLFQALSRRKTNLQKLDLTGVNLSQLEPGLLAEGLAGLEEVNP